MMVKYGIFAHPEAYYFMGMPLYTLKTKEGDMEVKPYDYIATGVDGEHWCIAKDILNERMRGWISESKNKWSRNRRLPC